MSANALIQAAVFGVACFFLVSVYHRREGIKHRLRRVVRVEVAFFAVFLLMVRVGQSPVMAILAGLVCALLVDRSAPSRSRYIPKSERRKAIARFEMTGRKFNPQTHEIDHVVPFSKGGSSTADNLEVIPRSKNRGKGAKSPWWDLLGR